MIFIAYALVMADEEKWAPIGSIDSTGKTVAWNIRRLRGRMPYTELAEKLEELKRPIPTLGLRKIESGGRRVDADDLVALALALGVSPNSLLMPRCNADDPVAVTGVDGDVTARRLWLWLASRRPLTVDTPDAALEFLSRSIPVWELEQYTLSDSGVGASATRTLRKSLDEQIFKARERLDADGDD
jgi:transcriptional regulator with XRE-family HTH domain